MNCSFCGKPDSPVRQVPAAVPASDCYCDDCADACAAHYGEALRVNRPQPRFQPGMVISLPVMTKFLDPADYDHPLLADAVERLKHHQEHLVRIGLPGAIPHGHRWWEYGLALVAAEQTDCKDVLDVGCGLSPWLPTLLQHHPEAFAVAVEPKREELAKQLAMCGHERVLGTNLVTHLPPNARAYDVVACISVIEHVKDEGAFLRQLRSLVKPGGVLFLTADAALLQPDTYQSSCLRERIYDPASWQSLAGPVYGEEWQFLGRADFTYKGAHVYDYTFASLALRRVA